MVIIHRATICDGGQKSQESVAIHTDWTSMLALKVKFVESRERFGYHLIRKFVSPGELSRLYRTIQKESGLFGQTTGRGNLGPRYSVIDGDQIQSRMPELISYEEQKVRPVVEEFASQHVKRIASSKRAIRVQLYQRRTHGFRWHFDGHSYVALLTLKNTIRGETQVVSPKLSSVLRYLPSPFYTVPHIFDFLPYWPVTGEEGDMLLMHGSSVLHRGVSLREEGERLLLVYAYDEADKKLNPISDKIARRINY